MYPKTFDLQKWAYISIPILFLAGGLMHFLYELSGEQFIVGLISPVNESVWEHTKMVLLPIPLYWALSYMLLWQMKGLDKNRWYTGAISSLITSAVLIPFIYYFYTQAFGVEIVVVDIFILLVAVAAGQLMGIHVYKYASPMKFLTVVLIYALILVIYFYFTISPPHLPIFLDGPTKTYGIFKIKQ